MLLSKEGGVDATATGEGMRHELGFSSQAQVYRMTF